MAPGARICNTILTDLLRAGGIRPTVPRQPKQVK
jgi:hypothetical protein